MHQRSSERIVPPAAPLGMAASSSSVASCRLVLTRAQQYLVFALLTMGLWMGCWMHVERFPAPTRFFVQIFPLWLAVTVGALLLGNVGYHLFSFGDCPAAQTELHKQVDEAKADLARRGLAL